jgi:hypothetical protein
MNCTCRADIEAKLLEHHIQQTPNDRNHEVQLRGYGFGIIGNKMVSRPYMPYEVKAEHSFKNGNVKTQTIKGTMRFNFCPFCGVKIGDDE